MPTTKISLASASRGRAELMRRAILSAVDLASKPEELEWVLRVDADDVELPTYIDLTTSFPGKANLIIGDRHTIGAAPYINEAAMSATGDFVLQFTDDLLVRTPEWDIEFLKVATSVDPTSPAAFIYDEKWATHGNPAVNRAWLEKAGCFYPEGSKHFFVDTVLFEVAQKTGRLFKVPICIQHLKGVGDKLFWEIRDASQAPEVVKKWREEMLELMT